MCLDSFSFLFRKEKEGEEEEVLSILYYILSSTMNAMKIVYSLPAPFP